MCDAPIDIFTYGLLSGQTDEKLKTKANISTLGAIAKSTTQQINVPSSARGLLITSGRDVDTMEIVMYSTTAVGVASVAKIRDATSLNVAVVSANTISIENASSAYGAMVYCIPLEGDIASFITSD